MATFGNRGYVPSTSPAKSIAASATGTKLFSTNTPGRQGFVASNGTCTSGILYFVMVPAGATAPTLNDVTSSLVIVIDHIDVASGKYEADGGVGSDYDIYCITSTGSAYTMPASEVF